MSASLAIESALREHPRRWLVTGSAGFIGSHLLETLLKLGQDVVSLDNFATGHRHNLDEVRRLVGEAAWSRHRFIEGDIRDLATCQEACDGVQVVLHQAALGSVPRSLADPLTSHAVNVTGFLNLLMAAREAKVERFVYAASSATYGDHPDLPKVEDRIGRPLSPYAVTKYANELYADVAARCYGMSAVGLRYFNVFGARQDPEGAYAAVIPRWVKSMLMGVPCQINGDGQTSRDFCYVANAVQANLLAAQVASLPQPHSVFNVAAGARTTLTDLHQLLAAVIRSQKADFKVAPPAMADFRAGDVRHSLASIDKATELLGYRPTHDVAAGLRAAIGWYLARFHQASVAPPILFSPQHLQATSKEI